MEGELCWIWLIPVIGVILYLLSKLPWIKRMKDRLEAFLLYELLDRVLGRDENFIAEKASLFATMGDKPLKILEVGIGTGMNFPYYPRGSEVYGIEPNPWFKDYIDGNMERCDHRVKLHLFEEAGEAMTSLQDESMDAVVLFYVLCSVNDVRQVMDESYRVLKPGGRLYYYQHVKEEKRFWLRILQIISYPFIYVSLSCRLIREYDNHITKAGFIKQEERHFDGKYWGPALFFRPHTTAIYIK